MDKMRAVEQQNRDLAEGILAMADIVKGIERKMAVQNTQVKSMAARKPTQAPPVPQSPLDVGPSTVPPSSTAFPPPSPSPSVPPMAPPMAPASAMPPPPPMPEEKEGIFSRFK